MGPNGAGRVRVVGEGVWQATQPALVKIGLPAPEVALQLEAGVSGSTAALWHRADDGLRAELTTPSEPQPARSAQAAIATRTSRRTGVTLPVDYHLTHEAKSRTDGTRDSRCGSSSRELAARALLHVIFARPFLFQALNVGLVPMLVIVVGIAVFQYWSSDKLALAVSGAKIVAREEAPELHAMVERLCAMADLPKPRVAVIDTDVPNAFATGPHARSTPRSSRDDRALASASSRRRSRACSPTSSRTSRTATC